MTLTFVLAIASTFIGDVMAVKRGVRLSCSACSEINYLTRRNTKKNPNKLELNKFCPRCRQAQIHKETKKK